MENKISDALQQPPSFDDMVGLIKKLFTDYLTDIQKNAFTAEEIEKAWERYKTLNHLWQDSPHPSPRWVKCSDRLPGYKLGVRWRDGNDHSFATKGKISLFEMDKPNLEGWEWLDEQHAAVSQDAHEKEIMMQAFAKVRKIFEGRQWVMDGRGSYPYNDDRYKEEVRYMYNEFDEVVKETWANIQSKSVDYRKAIIAEYLATPAAGREEDAVALMCWAFVNIREWDKDAGQVYLYDGSTFPASILLEKFKQHNP